MSKYTTELRFLCENLTGHDSSVGFGNTNAIIAAAVPKIFSFDFPIFDSNYRSVLCSKILKHYYTREICAETFGRWQLFLDAKMNEIMPYYNELYRSAQLEFDPMHDTDVVITHEGSENNNGSRNSTRVDDLKTANRTLVKNESNDENYRKFSDTPQGGLEGLLSGDMTYLTTLTADEAHSFLKSETGGEIANTGTQQNGETSKYDTTDQYVKKISGKNGGASYSKLLSEYRKTLINIDSMIIGELHDLFINIY